MTRKDISEIGQEDLQRGDVQLERGRLLTSEEGWEEAEEEEHSARH